MIIPIALSFQGMTSIESIIETKHIPQRNLRNSDKNGWYSSFSQSSNASIEKRDFSSKNSLSSDIDKLSACPWIPSSYETAKASLFVACRQLDKGKSKRKTIIQKSRLFPSWKTSTQSFIRALTNDASRRFYRRKSSSACRKRLETRIKGALRQREQENKKSPTLQQGSYIIVKNQHTKRTNHDSL